MKKVPLNPAALPYPLLRDAEQTSTLSLPSVPEKENGRIEGEEGFPKTPFSPAGELTVGRFFVI